MLKVLTCVELLKPVGALADLKLGFSFAQEPAFLLVERKGFLVIAARLCKLRCLELDPSGSVKTLGKVVGRSSRCAISSASVMSSRARGCSP